MNLADKQDWSAAYVQPTPAPYLLHARRNDYGMPDFAARFLRPLLARQAAERTRPLRVMDLGASYGIMSALIGLGLSFESLTDAFVKDDAVRPNTPADIARFYRDRPPQIPGPDSFFLADNSAPAMRFAESMGLCGEALCVDMRRTPHPQALLRTALDMDTIIAVGSLAYIGDGLFARLLPMIERAERSPLFVFGVYRTFYPSAIEAIFARHGYRLRRVGAPLPRGRRFATDAEQDAVVERARAMGLDPTGFESDGYYAGQMLVAAPVGATGLPIGDEA